MRLFAPLLALSLLASPALAAPTTLKVTIHEDGDEDSRVSINLPLSLAQAALAMGPVQSSGDGTIRIDGRDVKIADLRKLWSEVKKAGAADLVDIADGAERVKVSTKDGRVLVAVSEAGTQKVHVDVPHEVVDALLSGEGEQLDVAAAVAKLQQMKAGEIVRIDDGGSHVRVSLE